jgi:hypothetical protein
VDATVPADAGCISRRMATCEICGTEFDEHGVQIVLPGLAKSYDRIDCAIRARALAGTAAVSVPLSGALVDLGPGASRPYALHGLSAGLAAALAGGRARLALGGASVAVALLIATTVHLSSRGGDTSEAAARSPSLAPPARNARDFANRVRAAEATAPATAVRSRRQVQYAYLAAEQVQMETRPSRRSTSLRARVRLASRKAHAQTRHARSQTRVKSASHSVSTRPGWGRGDKNHRHSGPGKSGNGKAKGHKK